ncbi:hypothetical protein [Sorangium sp. So ce426]|uniref:hypothetical protein n=1 Tax=Sorangium sp. So ce426 TaxID=3133312 RepID=UPI003F5BB4DE
MLSVDAHFRASLGRRRSFESTRDTLDDIDFRWLNTHVFVRHLHRGLAAVHRHVRQIEQGLSEIALALFPPGFERVASDEHYAAAASHYSQPGQQRAGLFPFEVRALDAYFAPPPARLFVPGAGAGRELLDLVERGYSVDAIEPVPILAEAARRALAEQGRAHEGASVTCESLESWMERGAGGYDGILTGWGMWTHVVQRDARLAALRAFRRACPRGPVLLSFWSLERVVDDPSERSGAAAHATSQHATPLQAFTHGLLRQSLLAWPPVERGTVWRAGIFAHCVSAAELHEEATLGGYKVLHYERDVARFPNAVLAPA